MTKELIPNSKGKNKTKLDRLLPSYATTRAFYEFPSMLELTIGILAHRFKTGQGLLANNQAGKQPTECSVCENPWKAIGFIPNTGIVVWPVSPRVGQKSSGLTAVRHFP